MRNDLRKARRTLDEYLGRRQEALRIHATDSSASGLVPVCCEECGRPIATTRVDRENGEPAILLDFPENATGWTCTECAARDRIATGHA